MAKNFHLESFLEMMSVERGCSHNTLESYRRDLESFDEFCKNDAETCTREDITRFMQHLAGEGFAPRSRARKLSSLNQFFLYLYTEKIRKDNPCTNIDAPKVTKALPKFLSEKEVDKLIDTASDDLRLKAMLEVLYATGLRVSELISLKSSNIRKDGADFFVVVKGKGSKERMVPLNKLSIEAIKNYHARIEKSDWLFPSGKSHITRQRFGQLLKELALKANLDPEKLSPHVLRHSFASHMLAHGADLRLVQELLGHEQIATTQIYTHIQSTKLHKLVSEHHPLAKS